jgi:hypothetical protein
MPYLIDLATTEDAAGEAGALIVLTPEEFERLLAHAAIEELLPLAEPSTASAT